jgi:uncharacterized protein (DUF2141 family)
MIAGRLLVVLALFGASCGGGPRVEAPKRQPDAPTGSVLVRLTGFQNDRGLALVSLFLGPEGFPSEQEKAWRALALPIRDRTAEIRFEGVPAGPFAISAFHDENENYELDTGLFGIPKERWGVSRDAGGFLGPPRFESAVLELEPGADLEVEVPLG